MYKKYVQMVTLVDKIGAITPLFLVWEDGTKYKIDRILEVRNATSEVDGCGVLYRCRIQSYERNIYYEKNRWFIESHY